MFLSSVEEHIFLTKTNQNQDFYQTIFGGVTPKALWWEGVTPSCTLPIPAHAFWPQYFDALPPLTEIESLNDADSTLTDTNQPTCLWYSDGVSACIVLHIGTARICNWGGGWVICVKIRNCISDDILIFAYYKYTLLVRVTTYKPSYTSCHKVKSRRRAADDDGHYVFWQICQNFDKLHTACTECSCPDCCEVTIDW